MIPTGDFERLQSDIINRYDNDTITFGVLIADYEQTLAREYIMNYINVFDKKSNRYIDFFIPGYACYYGDLRTSLKNKYGEYYYFNRDLFERFIIQLEQYFGIRYSFNPELILIELKNNNFINSKKIVIELEKDITHTGTLFLDIFDIAKKHVDISDFSSELNKMYCKGPIIDIILNALGNNIVSNIYKSRDDVIRFKVIK